MKMCKIPESEMKLWLSTLDQLKISPGLDNADMYVGLGLHMQKAIDEAVEEENDG